MSNKQLKPKYCNSTIILCVQSIKRWLKTPSLYFRADFKKERWYIYPFENVELYPLKDLNNRQEDQLRNQIVIRWLFGAKFNGLRGFYLVGKNRKKVVSLEYEIRDDEIELSKKAFELFDNSWEVFVNWIKKMFSKVSLNEFRDLLKKTIRKYSPEDIAFVHSIMSRLSDAVD